MSRFYVWVSTDNAAFDDGNKAGELARILRDIADKLESSSDVPAFFQTVRDINGNDVGRYAEKSDSYALSFPGALAK